jgi:hypothetical protein
MDINEGRGRRWKQTERCVEVNAKTDNVTMLCFSPWRGESMLPLIPKIP